MASTLLLPSLSSASFLNNKFSKFCYFTSSSVQSSKPIFKSFKVRAIKEKTEEIEKPFSSSASAEEVTKRYGLEAGLWQVPTSLFFVFCAHFSDELLVFLEFCCYYFACLHKFQTVNKFDERMLFAWLWE